MKKIFTLVVAVAGGVLFGYSFAAGEGLRHGVSPHGFSSGFSITVGSGGGHFEHRHFSDRHFHRKDFHDRKFRHGHIDGRHFDGRHHDHYFHRGHRVIGGDGWKDRHFRGRGHDLHDRRFFRPYGGGIVIYGGRISSNYDDDYRTEAFRGNEEAGVENDSRTVTYRGNEIVPDDPDSRTVTYRGSSGGRRTIGNLPDP